MDARPTLLACLLLAVALPATAGTLYRCTGADGVPNYTGKKIAGSSCKVVSTYSASDARPRGPAPAAKGGGGKPGRAVRFQTASAGQSLAPVAPVSGAKVTRGAVYKYERDGVVHYTNVPQPGAGAKMLFSYVETCYACGVLPGVDFGNVRLNLDAYAGEVLAAAREFGVEEAIVRAIIHAESAFNPNALSRVGAQGLMQLMPATADRFGVVNAFDPAQNIRGGVQYLAWLLKRFNGDLTLAAAGYNAGEGAVDRHKGVPPYNETRRYVERVGILADRYRGQIAAN